MLKIFRRKNNTRKKRKLEIPLRRTKDQNGSVVSESQRLSNKNTERSFAIPEGLPMDPLAPAALAVSTEFMEHLGNGLTILRDHSKKVQKYVWRNRGFDILKKSWKSIVNVLLVETKGLPDGPDAGSNSLYCKFKLGTETHKSKRVSKLKATWRERFNMYLYDDNMLEVTVWHKGKQKNFMGRCVIDLYQLEKERTHDLWLDLECGYGKIHLLITLSGIARRQSIDNVLSTAIVENDFYHPEDKFLWYRLDDWQQVGQLTVTVHGARGLSPLSISSKTNAYCILEQDNSRVQTQTARGTSEPNWNRSYVFGVNDITSTLDIAVYDESIIGTRKGEMLGKISIPLLRINNYEKKWYALKNRSKKSSARGNCPRILLEMAMTYNPIKASLRVISPKEVKYTQKPPPKFDIPLIYGNLKVIKDIFHSCVIVNDAIKNVFEWNNRDKSLLALIAWLAFWYVFRIWMTPLLLLGPFLYHWPSQRSKNNNMTVAIYNDVEELSDEEVETHKDEKTIKTRINGLQDLTFTIKDGVDYLVSSLERLINLINFTVPYLSYLAMIVLVMAAVALYVIPANYLCMAFGIYKYMRKYLNPTRVPNNDLLDFLSRIPDNHVLKEWQELKVPEPVPNRCNPETRR